MRASAWLLVAVTLSAACAHDGAAQDAMKAPTSTAPDPDGPPPGASANARERDIDAGDVRLHARIVGSDSAAATLLVVNGGPGSSYEYITGLDVLAGNERRVVYVDERGVAPSTKPASGDYRLESHVADVEAVRAALGAARLDMLGHSWGTVVALAYAAAHPERVRSLILANPLALTSEVQKRAWEKLSAYEDTLVPLGLVPAQPPEPVGDDCTARDRARTPRLFANPRHPDIGMHGTRSFMEARKKSIEAIMAARVRGPVLVITGDADPYGQEPFEQVVRTMASAKVTTASLAHCGHDPFLEAYAGMMGTVREWFVKLGSSSS
jgi:pimeloyl-ACP methyl ester carboxylesterase